MASTISSNPSILLVEDDEHIAHLLEFMFEREGYRVRLVRDGRAAKAALEEENSSYVMLVFDVMLPFIDGFELIRLARQVESLRHVPIVMLTSKSQENDIIRALDAGAMDYVVKPFQPQELMARIRRHLRKPQ